MPDWMWLIVGPGGVGGVLMTWRYQRKCKVIERAIDKGDAELVDATGRALAPTAEAVRDVRRRREAKKTSPPSIRRAS